PTVVTVREGSEAVLPCSIIPEQNIASDVFEWKKDGQKEVFSYERGKLYGSGLDGQDEQFKGRVSHFPDQLQFGKASIVIRDTKSSDSGTYTCDFSPDEPNRQTFNIELVVCVLRDRSKENIAGGKPGAAGKPSVRTLDQTRDWAELQCEVRGVSPKPKVEWQDRAGNKLPAEEPQVTERGGSYDIVLQTTVTKTDHYSCVVTQEEICHQAKAGTFVFISDGKPGES
ncbi:butyrophilin-like protein 1, partial [Symphorus nematophorus]